MVGAHQARASIAHLYHAAARRKRFFSDFLPNLLVVLVSIATVVGVWFAAARYSAAELARLEERTKSVSADLVVALSEETEHTLDTARQAAAFIAYTYEQDHQRLDLSYWSAMHKMDVFPSASVLDEHGAVVTTSEQQDSFDYSTLPVFQDASKMAPAQFIIGHPVIEASGQWRIPTFTRISNPDGKFAGMVVIWLRVDSFADTYRRTALAPKDAMAVVGNDGGVRMLFGQLAEDGPYRRHLHNILTSPEPAGAFIAFNTDEAANTDTKAHIIAYGPVAHYPLLAVVSLDYDHAFTLFYARRRAYYEVAATVSIVVTLLAAALLFLLGKQRKTAQKLQEALAEEALHDALTGLANRSLFQDQCERAVARARRHAHSVAVLYLDLDEFKPINDQYGHAVGDLVLQEVSTRLRSCIRASSEDLVARLGGDEFCIILSNITRAQCGMIAEKILHAITIPMVVGYTRFELTASVGAALFPDETEGVKELIDLADRGMYKAKRAGKNNFCWGAAPPRLAKVACGL
ncbi:sensor domain-containing diguanylate cyclase [Castellaniella caeni]